MKTTITNERGLQEQITLPEDKSAWIYAGVTFTLLALVAYGGWFFCFG